MANNKTRSEYFAEATKSSHGVDFLGAFVLFAAGLFAPLANPVSDMKERWRKS